MTNGTTLFSGEVQLAGWKETHNGGATVTIWLADPEQLESFRRMTERKNKIAGQRLGMVLVEISDDETLVEQQALAKPPKEKLGPLGLLAVKWCESDDFAAWFFTETGVRFSVQDFKDYVGINKRTELDADEHAAHRFQTLIRAPYMDYLANKT